MELLSLFSFLLKANKIKLFAMQPETLQKKILCNIILQKLGYAVAMTMNLLTIQIGTMYIY